MTCIVCKLCGFSLVEGEMYFCAIDKEETHAGQECNLCIPIDDEGEEFHFVKEQKQQIVNTFELLEPW